MPRTAVTVVAAVFALSAGLASLAAAPAEAKMPQLRITPEQPNDFRLFDGEFIAVGRFVIEGIPGDEGHVNVPLKSFVVIEQGVETYQQVLEIAIGVDFDDDGRWNPDVDHFHPALPSTGDQRTGQRPDVDGTGTTVRIYTFDDGLVRYPNYPLVAWERGNDHFAWPLNRPERWFLLYRVSADAPRDIVFRPSFWEFARSPALFGMWLENEGAGEPDVIPDPTSFPDTGVYTIFDITYDLDRDLMWNLGQDPQPIDQEQFETAYTFWFGSAAHLPEFSLEGVNALNVDAGDRPVVAGQTNAVLGELNLTGFSMDGVVYSVSGLTVQPVGDPRHIERIAVAIDADGSGSWTDGLDVLLAEAPLDHVEQALTFSTAIDLADGQSERLLLLADFGSGVAVRMRYGLRVTDADVTDGRIAGLPTIVADAVGAASREPGVDLHTDVNATGERTVRPGEETVAGRLAIDARDATVVIRSIVLHATSDGGDVDTDIAEARILHDVNRDGLANGGDRQLATGTFSGGRADMALDGGVRLAAGGRAHLLVVFSFARGLQPGLSYRFMVERFQFSGDEVPVGGLLRESKPVTIISLTEDDPEFDAPPAGPFAVTGVPGTGCQAGLRGTAGWPLLAFALLGLLARRRVA